MKKIGEALAVNWNGGVSLLDAIKDENVTSWCDDFYCFVVVRCGSLGVHSSIVSF